MHFSKLLCYNFYLICAGDINVLPETSISFAVNVIEGPLFGIFWFLNFDF